MGRIGISEYQVFQAADQLAADGLQPSVDTVRVELGNTGSRTTINKYLKIWRERRAQRDAAGVNLSGHLRQVLTEQAELLLSVLEAESSAKLQTKAQEFEAAIQALQTRYQQLEQDHAASLSALESLRQTSEQQTLQLGRQRSELTDMGEQNQSLRESLAREAGRREALERAIGDRDRQVTDLQKELKASQSRNEVLSESIATKMAELYQLQQKERDQSTLLKNKTDELRQLNREISSLRTHSEKTLTKLTQSLAKLMQAGSKSPADAKSRRVARKA